jgi:hypothetical protein
MDGSPDASDLGLNDVGQLQTSIRHHPHSCGVPKWTIRACPPLQLVGLKGLDSNQVRGTPVRPVQFISSSSRNCVGGPSSSGVVTLATSKHGPDDSCILVGNCNRGPVEATPLMKLVDPCVEWVSLPGCRAHDGAGAMHQQAPQVLAAKLGDTEQHGPIAARVLSRHQSYPGREMPTVFELGTVADSSDMAQALQHVQAA